MRHNSIPKNLRTSLLPRTVESLTNLILTSCPLAVQSNISRPRLLPNFFTSSRFEGVKNLHRQRLTPSPCIDRKNLRARLNTVPSAPAADSKVSGQRACCVPFDKAIRSTTSSHRTFSTVCLSRGTPTSQTQPTARYDCVLVPIVLLCRHIGRLVTIEHAHYT